MFRWAKILLLVVGSLYATSITAAPKLSSVEWTTLSATFDGPRGIAVTSSGDLFVTDAHRVQHFDRDGQLVNQWGFALISPIGITVDRGRVYIVDPPNATVNVFTESGQLVNQWGSQGSGPGQFDDPYFVAVDDDGNVYVGDNGNQRIQKFTSDGVYLTTWGLDGTPFGIVVSKNVVSVMIATGHVQQFTTAGALLGVWAPGNDQLIGPFGLAASSRGDLYVANRFGYNLKQFTGNGDLLGSWGSFGTGLGQFNQPFGVAVSPNQTVYVTDWGNNRVEVLSHRSARLGNNRGGPDPSTAILTPTWGQLRTRYR